MRPCARTRVLSPRQLPTDHDCAVPTRGYQSDQPSHLLLPATRAAVYSHAPGNPLTSISGSRLLWVYVTIDKVAPYQKGYWAISLTVATLGCPARVVFVSKRSVSRVCWSRLTGISCRSLWLRKSSDIVTPACLNKSRT